MEDNNFVKGLFVKMPKDNAPKFILLDVSFKLREFVEWAKANMDERGWVNTQILRSKDGSKLYGKLNDWKPKQIDADTGEVIPNLDDPIRNPTNAKGNPIFETPMTDEELQSLSEIPF